MVNINLVDTEKEIRSKEQKRNIPFLSQLFNVSNEQLGQLDIDSCISVFCPGFSHGFEVGWSIWKKRRGCTFPHADQSLSNF